LNRAKIVLIVSLIIAHLVLCNSAFCQSSCFGPAISIEPNIVEFLYVTSGDIDGDGDIDLARQNTYELGWLENLGNGSFTYHNIFNDPSNYNYNITRVFISDIDNDLDNDIITHHENFLGIFVNDGLGNFSLLSFPSVVVYDLYEIIDFDEDGDIDLFANSDCGFCWLENNGGLSFTNHYITDLDFFTSFSLADINGDSLNDAIYRGVSSSHWVKNIGNQEFDTIELQIPQHQTIADINLDGYNDLVAIGSGQLVWYPNGGFGNFPQFITLGGDIQGDGSVLSLDFDEDGDIDIITASINESVYTTTFYKNDGSGNFDDPEIIYTETIYFDQGWPTIECGLTSAKVDNDLDEDLILYKYSRLIMPSSPFSVGSINWLSNKCGPSDNGCIDPNACNFIPEATFDDGSCTYPDCLGECNGTETIGSACNDGNPFTSNDVFQADCSCAGKIPECIPFPNPEIYINNSSSPASEINQSDIDNDGDLDILAISSDETDILLFENNGAGNFSPGQNLVTGLFQAKLIRLEDLNQDGNIDIILGHNNQSSGWFQGDGQGNFGPELALFPSSIYVRDLQIADRESDGDLDIFMLYSNRVILRENEGNENFSSSSIELENIEDVNAGAWYNSMHVTDHNGNGFQDVLISAIQYDVEPSLVIYTDGSLLYWKTYTGGTIVVDSYINFTTDGSGPYSTFFSLNAIDLDGDGLKDPFYRFCLGNDCEIKINNSNSLNISIYQSFSIGHPNNFKYEDLDQDGKVDIINGNALIFGDSTGIVGPDYKLVEKSILFTEDLDADEDVDLIGIEDGEIYWYENICSLFESPGCTDIDACNYDPNAITDIGNCATLDCLGICGGLNAVGNDCDDGDISTTNDIFQSDCICEGTVFLGCMDFIACNFNPEATLDDGSCLYLDCEGECDGVDTIGVSCDDGEISTINDSYQPDCICAGYTVPGCIDMMACNFDMNATLSDSSCLYNDCLGVCDGVDTTGASCDDGNPNTIEDLYLADCSCLGTLETLTHSTFNKDILLNVWPNPTSEYLYFQMSGFDIIKFKWSITDLYGKTLLFGISENLYINVKNLASGVYFLKLKTLDGDIYTKFIRD